MAAAELLSRRQARRNLLPFTIYTKPDYRAGPVHVHLSERLEAFEQAIVDGLEPRLMIFLPPRTGKTEMVLRFITWCLGRHPDWPVLYASYAADIAWEKSAEARAIVASPRFAAVFGRLRTEDDPDPVELDPSTQATHRWRIAGHRGGLQAQGVRGPLTGKGGKLLVWDDPVKNRDDADSEVISEKTWQWYTSTFRTRADPGAGIIGIMTRWHERDLAGRLLELANRDPQADQWEVLSLPAIAEDDDPLGRQPGEALDPGRFPLPVLLRTRATVGERDWAALYQQRPAPAGGATFRQDWWLERNRYDATDHKLVNLCVARWVSLDTAYLDKQATDFTACAVWELWRDYRLALRRVWQERVEFPDLLNRIEQEAGRCNRDGKLQGVIIEDKGSGTSALQTLRSAAPEWLAGMLVPFMPTGSKEERARQASLWCERGRILLPEPSEAAEWLFDFEQQLFKFPTAAHDDMVDAFSQGVLFLENYLAAGWQAMVREMVGDVV